MADVTYEARGFDASSPANLGRAVYDDSVMGYSIGAGLEHMLTDSVSLKAEYIATLYEQESACWEDNAGCVDTGVANDDSVHWKSTLTMFRVGANYNF